MSEHAEAGKTSSLENGGYEPLQIGDEDNDSPQGARPNNNGIKLEKKITLSLPDSP